MPEAASKPFAAAEILEFRGALDQARQIYAGNSHSLRLEVRSGALLRLARVQRKDGDLDGALQTYAGLAGLEHVAIDGMPADLVARRTLCGLLAESGRQAELRREAEALRTDFLAGRWALDRAAWELTAQDVSQWLGAVMLPPEGQAFSEAAGWLWEQWPRLRGDATPQGSHVMPGSNVTLVWRGEPPTAIAISARTLESWRRRAGGNVALVFNSQAERGTMRRAAETGLPWTIAVDAQASTAGQDDFAQRRRLLGLGLAAIVLLLAGAAYLLWRVMQRELAVARLQTDFVAAVSHEFRTPLTSLQHVRDCQIASSPVDQLRRNLEMITRELTAVYKFAANTSPEAYAAAESSIKAGHFSLSEDEIDALLPESLRKNKPKSGTA